MCTELVQDPDSLCFPQYFRDCLDYEAAIEKLTQHFSNILSNEIFARHLLASRSETLSEFLRELHMLSKDCNIKGVSAEEYREELIRDTFISGLASPMI